MWRNVDGIGLFLEDETTEFADDLHLRGRCEGVKKLAKKMPRFFALSIWGKMLAFIELKETRGGMLS